MAGFTLVEMMAVVCVIAILLAFAVPSFTQFVQANRAITEINAFADDLQFARSEAIKEGANVTICSSSDGASCSGSTLWQGGWIIFSDPNANQTVDAGELVIRRQSTWTSTDTLVSSSAVPAISYSRDGFAVGLPGTVTVTLHVVPSNANATRCLILNLVGHQQVVTVNGSTCT